MLRYNIIDYYDFPLRTVAKLLMDSEIPIYEMAELPNVSNSKELEIRDEGDKKYIKVEWCVHGQIPKIAQKLVRPEMLTFIEDSVWDRTTNVYSTRVIPHHFKKQVNCRHRVELKDNGDGRTKRILAGFFEFKVPVIGPIFEQVILKYLKQNAEADFKMGQTALKKYIEKHGEPK